MYEAKINNLGLSSLIRLSLLLKCLSFLGGEAQRPLFNNNCKVLSSQDCNNVIHLDSINIVSFLSPSRLFSLCCR